MIFHRFNSNIYKKAWVWFILYVVLFRVEDVFATHVHTPASGGLVNPTVAKDIPTFLKAVVDILIKIGIPLAALAIIYAGFLFVTAGGSEEKVKIGTAILLGAWVIITTISDTVTTLTP